MQGAELACAGGFFQKHLRPFQKDNGPEAYSFKRPPYCYWRSPNRGEPSPS